MKTNFTKTASVSRMVFLFSIALFFSTYYGGGNSLYFLNADTLSLVRNTAIFICVVSGLFYLFQIKEHERAMILENDRYYYKGAHEYIKANHIPFDVVERAIKNGKKKVGHSTIQYRWTDEKEVTILVYITDEGHVTDVAM